MNECWYIAFLKESHMCVCIAWQKAYIHVKCEALLVASFFPLRLVVNGLMYVALHFETMRLSLEFGTADDLLALRAYVLAWLLRTDRDTLTDRQTNKQKEKKKKTKGREHNMR